MQKRSVRFTALIVLLASAAFIAAFWSIQHRIAGLVASEYAFSEHAGRVVDTLAAVGTAQQSYVAPGQLDEQWFEESAALLARLRDEITTLQSILRSPDRGRAAQSIAQNFEELTAADARTRENLGRGQELMAADVIYSDGRNVLSGMRETVRELQEAEYASYAAGLGRASHYAWLTLVALMAVWAGAAIVLIRIGRASDTPAAAVPAQLPAEPGQPEPRVEPSIDLTAAAALCTDLSRAADTATLTSLLARAASVLHASGVMLWMSAGEQLFAALAHGYPPDILPRLAPITRDGDNAAAKAWRSGRLVVVAPAGGGNAAVVAPLFNPTMCIGVLAVEISPGHAVDQATEVATALIAAQLATVVAAWPAASVPGNPVSQAEARTA